MTTVAVPDIGDFTDVPVVEILVEAGQRVAAEDPLVALESDKATMEVPAPVAGVITKVLVALGDTVSEGTALVEIEAEDATPVAAAGASADGGASPGTGAAAAPVADAGASADGGASPGTGAAPAAAAPTGSSAGPGESGPAGAAYRPGSVEHSCQLVVIGAGPGGYTAAFRAADLGLDVILVERHDALGGVCLNVGCIPSKTLLHLAAVITESEAAEAHGLRFGAPAVDLDEVRAFKDGVVTQLTSGLAGLAKQRKVRVLQGEAKFTGTNTLSVGSTSVGFEHAIIAVGSSAATLPGLPEDPRIMGSTGALALEEIPPKLLVIGGGIIGLEMATVYDAFGSTVTVVELADQLIPGCDPDIVKPLAQRVAGRYAGVYTGTSVEAIKAQKNGLKVTFSGDLKPALFDRVLVAVGRRPNGGNVAAEVAGVAVDERGFIAVDPQLRTNVGHIFAIGDVVGEPMLAHKATHQAKVAAEVIAGEDVIFDARAIPAVAYTDPEVAWSGLTETRARADGIEYEVHKFPWAASGRALGIGRPEGLTKLLVEPGSQRILGAGIVGPSAGELIAEPTLALELGANASDVGLTIHAHPTLAETVALAAEVATGSVTDIPSPRRKR